MPSKAEDDRLEKFFNDSTKADPDFRLDFLMDRYSRQEGLAGAFSFAVTGLLDVIRPAPTSLLFSDLMHALQLLNGHLQDRYSAKPSAAFCEPSSTSVLGQRYKKTGETAGRAEFWNYYPLKNVAADHKTVLFIPAGIDRHLNPWADDLAFPGSNDTFTRFCDLAFHNEPDEKLARVTGRDGRVYEVPAEYHLVSLDPRPTAGPDRRLVVDRLCYFEGEDSAVADSLLDPIHTAWRSLLGNRKDVTPLLPLTTRLFELFPGFIQDPHKSIELKSGSIGNPDAQCRLNLPLGDAGAEYRHFTW